MWLNKCGRNGDGHIFEREAEDVDIFGEEFGVKDGVKVKEV